MTRIQTRDGSRTIIETPEFYTFRETVEQGLKQGADFSFAELQHLSLDLGHFSGGVFVEADFNGAGLYQADLSRCDLRKANLRFACLRQAQLIDADLRGAVLYDANLSRANLTGANLNDANLRDARFTGAYVRDVEEFRKMHPHVPFVSKLDGKILKRVTENPSCLDMYDWHQEACKTTHCRAGHAIDLAGSQGYALEAQFGPGTAGALIYLASTGRVPDFYATRFETITNLIESDEYDSLRQ